MEKIEVQASNIKCGGCVSNIESGLTGLQGVSKVSIDITSNKVSVEGTALDRTVIVAKLTELGYPPA